MLIELIKGASLLCALCYLQSLHTRWLRERPRWQPLVSGCLYGLIVIIGMLTGLRYVDGVIYDARGVVLSMAGLFGGPLVACLAAAIAILFRFWMGGVGSLSGVCVIVLSVGAGLAYRYAHRRGWVRIGAWQLFVFALLLHLVATPLLFVSPAALVREIVHDMAPLLVVALVPSTVVLGLLLRDNEERERTLRILRLNEAHMRALGRTLPDPVFVLDATGRYLLTPKFDEPGGFGMRPGPSVHEVLPAPAAEVLLDAVRRTLGGEAADSVEYAIPHDDGMHIFEARSQPLEEPLAGQAAVVFIARDVTRRKQAERALCESEGRLHAFFELGQVGMAICAPDTRWLSVNGYLCHLLEYPEEELRGRSWQELTLTEDLVPNLVFYERMLNGEIDDFEMEKHFISRSGRCIPTRLIARCARKPDRSVDYVTAIIIDISLRKQTEAALRESEQRYRLAFQTSPDSISITRLADGLFIDVNVAFERITGWHREEVVGRTVQDLGIWNEPAARARLAEQLRRTGYCENMETYFVMRDGRLIFTLLSAHVLELGGEECLLTTARDISYRKANEEAIRRLAFFDPLTQLPNRRLLLERLQQALQTCERTRQSSALLFIDLDDFKTLNDTLGHHKGDLLLQQVARRLSERLRESDTVTRLGGDEFVLILESLSPQAAEAAAQAETVAGKLLFALAQPFSLDGAEYLSGGSIGIALFHDAHLSCDELMRRADLAMYQAKAAGRGTLRFFDPSMQDDINARVSLESGLREALSAGHFLLHFQPQVDAARRVAGAEVLVRWRHPQKGLILPGSFIAAAEESGLILPLGRWILQEACRCLAAWRTDARFAGLTLAVNVSARQCRQAGFVEEVMAAIDASGADPRRLKLELTESMLLDDIESIIGKMAQLQARGVSFALDDFGTGYSSLAYLKRLPLAQLKIDRSFVRDVLDDPNDAVIAQSIIALAQNLDLEVIAEGVENEAQHAFLAAHGCRSFQGYLYGRPLPREEFERALA